MQGLGSGSLSPPEPQSPSQVLQVDPSFQHFPTQPGEGFIKKDCSSPLLPSPQLSNSPTSPRARVDGIESFPASRFDPIQQHSSTQLNVKPQSNPFLLAEKDALPQPASKICCREREKKCWQRPGLNHNDLFCFLVPGIDRGKKPQQARHLFLPPPSLLLPLFF